MRFAYSKITVIRFNQVPEESSVDHELQWFGSSLGLFNLRDKDKSCYRLFVTLIKATKNNKALTSDELGELLSLSRGTIIFHINKLISAGIVTEKEGKYSLRDKNLGRLIKSIENDAIQTYKSLHKIACELDQKIGLE